MWCVHTQSYLHVEVNLWSIIRCDNCLLVMPLVSYGVKWLEYALIHSSYPEGGCNCLGRCDRCKAISIPILTSKPADLAQAYSLAGGIFLLVDGQYIFFFFPEWWIHSPVAPHMND